MAHHQNDDATQHPCPDTRLRRRGLLLAGLFLCMLAGVATLLPACSQPQTREARSGAEAAKKAGEATRTQPSPVQYRTNTSDAGTPDAQQSTPDAE